MKLNFLGAAREVTGSCSGEAVNIRFWWIAVWFKVGVRRQQRNHDPFPFDPASIDFVLDPCPHRPQRGHYPSSRARDSRGPSTRRQLRWSICFRVMLPDSEAHIQESDARRDAKRFKDKPVLPRIPQVDVHECLQQVRRVIEYDWGVRSPRRSSRSFS